MIREYSPEIAEAVSGYLTREGWKFRFQQQTGVFRFFINRDTVGTVHFVLTVYEHDFCLYALLSNKADLRSQDTLHRLAEFITRANYDLRSGNFEMDYRDGEIRYRYFVDCEGIGVPSYSMIDNAVYCALAFMDHFGIGLLRILFSDISPLDAMWLCLDEQERRQAEAAEPEEESPDPLQLL